MFLLQVTKKLEELDVQYAVVGGYGLALHGLVRATMDIDLVIKLKASEFKKAELAMQALGLTSRIPLRAEEISSFREEYISKRNLIAWSWVNFQDPSQVVDLLLTTDLKNIKPVFVKVGGQKISVASLEDLQKMKQASGRPQDLVDAENIKRVLNEKKKS